MAQDVDVVIIGAGISGLTTAYEINQKDPSLSFAVLEAKGNLVTDDIWLMYDNIDSRSGLIYSIATGF